MISAAGKRNTRIDCGLVEQIIDNLLMQRSVMDKLTLSSMLLLPLLLFYPPAEAGEAYYEYDANGRLLQCNYASQAMVRYTYDAVGNATSIASYQVAGFIDSDDDGIDDNWELFYFPSLQIADDITDFDQDGYPDLEEYLLWKEGTLDDNGLAFTPLTYNRGEKNPAKNSILMMIVPVLSAGS
ncbi:MAG: RHS repeat protein [Proteobacteria bacterium]|nr:RHS repeat protein [Pseudomonadota bacterium]